MRKALIVGIDHYAHVPALHGCVNDAFAVKNALERHGDGSVNFGVNLVSGVSSNPIVSRHDLKGLIKELFADDNDVALLYFAGHGSIDDTGGYILTGECKASDDGVSLADVLAYANRSPARNKVVVLDSCYSGIAGAHPANPANSQLSDGLTILTASTANQYANETGGHGTFTDLFVDALSGSAANLVGDITPGSVYAHIDQSLGPWAQRPVFKTNVKSFVSLRTVPPAIDPSDLRRIVEFFPEPGYEFALDPTFEPERSNPAPGDVPPPNPENTQKFAILQKYNRVNLVVPVSAPHMWHAAMSSKSCKLTALGEHYRRLAASNLL